MLINSSFADVFDEINEIFGLVQNDDIDKIMYDVHECIIFENIPNKEGLLFDVIVSINENEQYKIRLIMAIPLLNILRKFIVDMVAVTKNGGYKKKLTIKDHYQFQLILTLN